MKNTILVNGKRYVCKIWDSGESYFDRFTVVFKSYRINGRLTTPYLGLSEKPFHPHGFGCHGEFNPHKGEKPGKHLGKRITFESLPIDCQKAVLNDLKRD